MEVRTSIWGRYFPSNWEEDLSASCRGEPRPSPGYISYPAWDRLKDLSSTPHEKEFLRAGATKAIYVKAQRNTNPRWLGLDLTGRVVIVAEQFRGSPHTDFGPMSLLRKPSYWIVQKVG